MNPGGPEGFRLLRFFRNQRAVTKLFDGADNEEGCLDMMEQQCYRREGETRTFIHGRHKIKSDTYDDYEAPTGTSPCTISTST